MNLDLAIVGEGFFAVETNQRIFFITGRIKEIICRGAEKYSPIAIERRIKAGTRDRAQSVAGTLLC